MNGTRITYAGGRLDRAGDRRKDEAWLAAARARDDVRLVPVAREASLVVERDGAREAALCPADLVDPATAPGWIFLGLDGGAPRFAVDVPDDARAAVAAACGGEFEDLRRVGPLLAADDAALLAYARGMVGWHRRTRHCGGCGAATEPRQAGHVRVCAACGVEQYPRTDPAVIMLVHRAAADGEPARCLLARSPRFQPGMYSTLAGFVEPGESLEDAVARETLEETGVRVGRVTYVGSQPWPFPSSLMLGFRAEAETTALTIDGEEIADARWFTAAELATFGEWGDEGAALRLPRRDSIARLLVDGWIADVTGDG
jgi:NAD+ diphosphatase